MATAELETPPAATEPAAPKIANVPGRLGPTWLNRVRAVAGLPWKRRLAKAALLIPKIRYYERRYVTLNDDDMKAVSMKLRGRARGGERLDRMIPEAFGLACAAIRRVKGFQPFDVQLAAGVVMHYGGLVELATGEGKTLSAVAPAYLNALPGKGVHVTTVNDYLAKRDAEEMTAVYK
ncbi:MAG: preprotein translocase subunit SecA, partial [Fimbriiglobus sp.]